MAKNIGRRDSTNSLGDQASSSGHEDITATQAKQQNSKTAKLLQKTGRGKAQSLN